MSTLFARPSLSKHLGGQGLVVAAHRVIMGTLCACLMLLVAPPSFQAPSPSSSIVDEFKQCCTSLGYFTDSAASHWHTLLTVLHLTGILYWQCCTSLAYFTDSAAPHWHTLLTVLRLTGILYWQYLEVCPNIIKCSLHKNFHHRLVQLVATTVQLVKVCQFVAWTNQHPRHSSNASRISWFPQAALKTCEAWDTHVETQSVQKICFRSLH